MPSGLGRGDKRDEDPLEDFDELDEFGELLEGRALPDGDSGLAEISRETVMVSPHRVVDEHQPPALMALRVDEHLPDDSARLVVVSATTGQATIYPIEKSLVLLGRVADVADLVVDDDAASRHHAAVVYRDSRFEVHDLGSTNGTLLDGRKVLVGALAHGSEIRIGKTVVRFEAETEAEQAPT